MILSIIIVSFNTKELLDKCIRSLMSSLDFCALKGNSEVIVIDNNSSDGSREMVKRCYPKVILINNQKNQGFAKANNQGLKIARGKYILLLNSDTEVKKEVIGKFIKTISQKREADIIGPKLLNTNGSLQLSCGYFPHIVRVFFWMFFLDDLSFIKTKFLAYHVNDYQYYCMIQYPDWISGACIFLKREVVQKIGGMDENIFMYAEEVEWCYRMIKAGYKIMYFPEISVSHHKGQSSSEGGDAGIVKEFQSLFYLYKKYKPSWQQTLLRFFLLGGVLLRIVIFGIIGKYPKRINIYAKALGMVRQ